MKTTIDLPDEVFHQAKIFAAQQRTTLKALIVEGLTQVIGDPPSDAERKRKEEFIKLFSQIKAQNTEAMVPLTREEIYDRQALS